MSARISILVSLAGCNGLLGLGDVVLRDAAIDASTHCPAAGVVPQYSSSITQYVVHSRTQCGFLQFDAARDYAIMRCYDPITCGELTYEGPPDGVMTQALPATYTEAKLDPDGSTLYALEIGSNGFISLRRGAGGWVDDKPMQIGPANAISTIARVGDTRHVLSLEPSAVDAVHVREWIATNGTWTEQGTYYTAAMFGLLVFDTNFDLSPDGLRIILQAVGPGDRMQQMYYLDRPSIDARFETAQRIDMLRVLDPFITEDCTQVYFSDLDRTFYVSRQ